MNNSLLALACGDSYGSYFEREGLFGVVFELKSLPNKAINKTITDDTKMATILLKHYKKYKTLQEDKLFEAYNSWAKRDGAADGIGIHTYNVLVKNQSNKDSQGNGALMRVIPFALQLVQDGYSFEDAITFMNKDSALTHKNQTIFMANRLSLDIALNGLEVLNKDIYKELISRLHLGSTAWVIHSLYIVIEALKKDFSFIEGFKYIVSYGGDTDTNCAIYGAIKGHKEDIFKSLPVEDFLTDDIFKFISNEL